jgi:DNA-binding response OmpR family regulator
LPAQLIAVVSHDTAHLKDIDAALTRESFETMLLSRSSGAFEAIRKAQPNLVMLDSRIESEQVGWQLVQELRLDMRTAEIPLLVLSAEDPTAFDKKAPALRRHQRVEVLPVPFDTSHLVEEVKRMLGQGA